MSDAQQPPVPWLLRAQPVQPSDRDARTRRLLERRVEIYRQRVAAIEAEFGADARLPADVNLFDRDADGRDARASA